MAEKVLSCLFRGFLLAKFMLMWEEGISVVLVAEGFGWYLLVSKLQRKGFEEAPGIEAHS